MPREVSTERMARLLALENRISDERNARFLGRNMRVLADCVSKNNPDMLTGKGDCVRPVHFRGSPDLIGEFVNLKITDVSTFSFEGEISGEIQ